MAYPTEPPTYGRKPPCYGPNGGIGDIGGDGRVDASDQAIMMDASTGDVTLSPREAARADLDGNGEPADATDVARLMDYVSGDTDTFPICAERGYPTEPPTYGRKPPCYGPNGGIGDIGGDGRVDGSDHAMMMDASVGDITLSPREAARADLDGNGKPADASDVARLMDYVSGDTNTFPICTIATTPMETRVMSLEEGKNYTIEVQLPNHEVLKAEIEVSASGVTCVDVTGGACGGSSLPRVEVSGWTVTTHLKSIDATSGYDEWLESKGGLSAIQLGDIFELKDAFIGLDSIGFTPVMEQIMECKDAFIGL